MRRLFIILGTLLVISAVLAQPAFAQVSHHAGNQQSSAYGLKADIYTPSSAPYCGSSGGESSWVGTASSYWVQTGWLYYPIVGYAQPFVEINLQGQPVQQQPYGSQSWGTYKNYDVEYYSYLGDWDAAINGEIYASAIDSSLPTPPTTMSASAEVHDSTTTVLNTVFNNGKWKNSSSNWSNMNQWYVVNYSPYYDVTFYSNYYYFLCYGP